MIKYKKILRFTVFLISLFVSIILLASMIYLLSDYENNVMLNAYIDDFTIVFIGIAMLFFLLVAMLEYSSYKKIKNCKTKKK